MYKSINFYKNDLLSVLNINKKNINNIGIKNIYYPFIFDNNGILQKTIGIWNLSIFLKYYKRGCHMSRFLRILDIFTKTPLNILYLKNINKLFQIYLSSNNNYVQVSFIYFLSKFSPISNFKNFLSYKISLLIKNINIYNENIIKINIPVISLCPCSKLISIYNAHNQRTYIKIIIKFHEYIDINYLINTVEEESSCQLWTFLKRVDEKYITEFSYKNPKFIEDLIRNLYYKIKNYKISNSFYIKIENFESIHNHNVFSIIYN